MRKIAYYVIFLIFTTNTFAVHAELRPLEDFGENPGELSATYYPASTQNKIGVILLHGCVQNGKTFASNSGFLGLAKKEGFNLLIPQQASTNNIQSCFNWFSTQDTDLDSGEMLSLKNMVLAFKEKTQSTQLYLAGLSAGGAMASAFMYQYPELLDGVAIVAGIPYPCADNLTKAISCMRSGPNQSSELMAKTIQKRRSTDIELPRLTIWTGLTDSVVNPKNSSFGALQWLAFQNVSLTKKEIQHQGFKKTVWENKQNIPVLELIEVKNFGHGLMINRQENSFESPSAYLLPAPISASKNIVKFWMKD